MQHILFYEAKQSVKFQRNALNVDATVKTNTENENKNKAQSQSQVPKPQDAANETNEVLNSQQAFEDPFKKEEEQQQEINHKEEEKQKINKQITYINALIVILLVGIVVLFFTI